MKRTLLFLLPVLVPVMAACGLLNATDEWRTETVSAGLGGAERAAITINNNAEDLTVNAADTDSGLLIAADVDVVGDVAFSVSGDSDREVSLSEQRENISYNGDHTLEWEVEITQAIPVTLDYTLNSGDARLNLESLDLTGLTLDVNSGRVLASLPAIVEAQTVALDVNSGSVGVTLADGASGTLTGDLNSGDVNIDFTGMAAYDLNLTVNSGEINVNVPDGAAARVDLTDNNSGTFNADFAGLTRISGDDDDTGIWQTDGFDAADMRITVALNINSGTVTVE